MILSDNEPLADWAPSSVFVKRKRSEALFSKHEETELDPRDFVEVSLAERTERVELVSDSSLEEAEEVARIRVILHHPLVEQLREVPRLRIGRRLNVSDLARDVAPNPAVDVLAQRLALELLALANALEGTL